MFQVPERIRAMNSSVKLMLIVREPVTRAISDYTQLRSHAATPSSSAQAQKSFEQLALRADGSVNEAYKPLAVSLYHTYTHRWLEVLFKYVLQDFSNTIKYIHKQGGPKKFKRRGCFDLHLIIVSWFRFS